MLLIRINNGGTPNPTDSNIPLHRLEQQNSYSASVSEYSDTPVFQPVSATLAEMGGGKQDDECQCSDPMRHYYSPHSCMRCGKDIKNGIFERFVRGENVGGGNG